MAPSEKKSESSSSAARTPQKPSFNPNGAESGQLTPSRPSPATSQMESSPSHPGMQ